MRDSLPSPLLHRDRATGNGRFRTHPATLNHKHLGHGATACGDYPHRGGEEVYGRGCHNAIDRSGSPGPIARRARALPGTAPGFTLQVGYYPLVKATVDGNGWHVTVRDRAGLSNDTYPSDEAFLAKMDELLEPLVKGAFQALVSGVEPPAPDAYGRS